MFHSVTNVTDPRQMPTELLSLRVVSERTVSRLALYRRVLIGLARQGVTSVYSHELAGLAKATAAQVRRDLMVVGYEGSPTRGYSIDGLLRALGNLLDGPEPQRIGLVGVGNLGRALLSYFVGRQTQYSITAAFDSDPAKIGRSVNGCPVHTVKEMGSIIREQGIETAIVAVPADDAQQTANDLCRAGITGILNFAPVRVWVPEGVHIEHLDLSVSLERVAFFARHKRRDMGEHHGDNTTPTEGARNSGH